jgi:hypothetical protein
MGQLSAVEARSYFTSCASFLQQHLSGILWKGYHKQTGGPHEGPFEVDSRILECLQKMSEPLQTMAGLIAPYEFERPDPKISHLLNKAVESLEKVCEERSLGSYHTALSILVVAFIELSLAV